MTTATNIDIYRYRQITAEEHSARTNTWVTDYWRRPTCVWRQRSLTIDLQALINSHWARNNPSRIAERLWVDRWRVKTVDIGTVTLLFSGFVCWSVVYELPRWLVVQPRRGQTRVYNDDHCVITHSFSIYDYTISSRRIALFKSAPRRLLARLASIDTR